MKVNSTATTMKLPLLLQSSNQHCLYLSVTIGKHLEVSPREGLQQQITEASSSTLGAGDPMAQLVWRWSCRADRLPVVVRIPAGPLGSLKCDPPKGNGRRPKKNLYRPLGLRALNRPGDYLPPARLTKLIALLWPDASQDNDSEMARLLNLGQAPHTGTWVTATTVQHLPISLARLFSEETLSHLNVESCLISAILAVLLIATAPEEFGIPECTTAIEAAGLDGPHR